MYLLAVDDQVRHQLGAYMYAHPSLSDPPYIHSAHLNAHRAWIALIENI